MNAATASTMAVRAAAPAAAMRAPLQRAFGFMRRAAANPTRPRCRAATLPALEDLAEACAPEGALYVNGALFGRDEAF
jgi:hypothetical protein